MTGLAILGAIVVLIALVVFVYNNLIKLRNKVDEGWADIDTQLKRRYDLIPNIVETVKGYASHESQTLEKIVQARSSAMNAQNLHDKEAAENMLTDTLKSLFALAEQYPDLKANQNFMGLQTTLNEIEEHIQMSRRYYNGTVRDFNTQIQVFPTNLVANVLGFKEREFFQATGEEKENVKVSFKEGAAPASPAAPTEPTPPAAPTEPTAPTPTPPAAPTPKAPTETPEPPKEPQK